jgi:hypothetical protein
LQEPIGAERLDQRGVPRGGERSVDMAKTVVALMENPEQARQVVTELWENGFARDDISIVSRDIRAEGEAVFKGSVMGAALGALVGMLMAGSAFAIPGLGPVLVAGPMAGGGIGALAGGLASGLIRHGVPEDDAHFYAEGVRRGGTLITVTARTDELAARAVDIMKRYGAADIETREAQWREHGWNGRSETGRTRRSRSRLATDSAP